MYAIEVQTEFSAAHQLRLPDGGIEPRHEHVWGVTVRVESAVLDALETVMDFHLLDQWVAAILQPWQGRSLNEIEPFVARINPSAERVAERIAQLLLPSLTGSLRLVEVRVTEAPRCTAIWRA